MNLLCVGVVLHQMLTTDTRVSWRNDSRRNQNYVCSWIAIPERMSRSSHKPHACRYGTLRARIIDAKEETETGPSDLVTRL
jgi:hypothetical protein